MFPFHKNTPHREFIRFIQPLGRMKVEHQNVVIPEMTVFIRSSLPTNDNALELQEESFLFICCSSTSQFNKDSFFVQRGTPRYLTGNDPRGIPVEAWIASVSIAVNPEAKNEVLCILTAKPDLDSNSRST